MELLVASVFSECGTAAPPASRSSGFLRFLQLLGSFPWALRPLIVDPQHEIDEAGRRNISREHTQLRATGKVSKPLASCLCLLNLLF